MFSVSLWLKKSTVRLTTAAQHGIGRSQNGQMEEGFTEPAKLADRVIAPGEGSAEPGVYGPKIQQSLRSWRQMLSYEHLYSYDDHSQFIHLPSLSHTSWLGRVSRRVSQARRSPRQGLSLFPPASQAR